MFKSSNESIIKKSLKKFSGVQRRMTKIFSKNKNDFYDDHAHHPTEITSILEGVRNVYKDRKIISVFEPHRYSRVLLIKKRICQVFFEIKFSSFMSYLCCWGKKNSKYNVVEFAKLISKYSRTPSNNCVKIIMKLKKYFNKSLISDEIIQ